MRRISLKLLLGATSALAAVLLTEAALRLFAPEKFWHPVLRSHWDWVVADPLLGWKNQPGYEHEAFRINSLGFRGEETAVEKPPGRIRIICQGDSGTFGLLKRAPGERGWYSYPEFLKELLREVGRQDVEVVNAGVLGYTASHGLVQLQTQLLELEPDVLIARFGFNDHAPAWGPNLRVQEPESALGRSLFYSLAGWRLVDLARMTWRSIPQLHPAPMSVPWLQVDAFAAALRRISELAQEHETPLLFLDYPLRALARGESVDLEPAFYRLLGVSSLEELHKRHERYQRVLASVARETHTPLLDTASLCAAAPEPCFNAYDLNHPDQPGARLIAAAVYRELGERGWLSNRFR